MEKEKKIEAYNRLLYAVLDYVKKKELINNKQRVVLRKYCIQSDETKDTIKFKTVKTILNTINKKSNKRNIAIPDYEDLTIDKSDRFEVSENWNEQKEIEKLLKSVIDSCRGECSDISEFVRRIIKAVKVENKNLLMEKEQQKNKSRTDDEQLVRETIFNSDYYNSRTNLSKSYERKEDVETKKRIEEREVNDLDTVKDIMLREEIAFDKSLEKGYVSYFELGESYTLDEKKRKEYLTENLSVTTSQKRLSEEHKKLDNSAASSMIRDAEGIEDLIVQNLLKVNFDMSRLSELHKQTLLKSKYNPHRLLEQYKKLYDKYSKQFDKIPDKEKERIKVFCENNGMDFIPSPEDIIAKINSRIQEKMIEYNVGIRPDDSGKLCGSYALTTYMNPEQIARTEYLIKQKIEKQNKLDLDPPRIVTEYDVEQEWNKAWRLNNSGVSKESIRKDLEEQYRNINEAILQKKTEKERNLQYNYSTAIYVKENENRSLTQICREVLHEEPMFEELKKEKESKALIEKDKVNGFSFKSIKAAIARALDRKER